MMQRSLTPTSPSPSPPPTNPQSQPNAHHSLLPPNQTLNPTPTSTSNSTSHPNTTSIIPVPTSSDNRGPSQAAAAAASSSSLVQPSIPISEAAAAENARQDLESATHSLVQSLYDLAQCTNDITKGEERMIPDKMWVQQCHLPTPIGSVEQDDGFRDVRNVIPSSICQTCIER